MTLILLPDANALITDHTAAWVVYLTLQQVQAAGWCFLAAFGPRNYGTRVILMASALWLVGQGIDEATNGNLFTDGAWEFGFLATYGTLIYLHLRQHDTGKPIEEEQPH